MKSGERVDLSKIALNIMKTLDDFPLPRRAQILHICQQYLNFDVADDQMAKQVPPVKDEHFDA